MKDLPQWVRVGVNREYGIYEGTTLELRNLSEFSRIP
jgi:hypothetical protein